MSVDLSKFPDYFKENMDALGLPAPASLYSSAVTALATIRRFKAFVTKYGKKVTVKELIKAGIVDEQLEVIELMVFSAYLGCLIGSACVALQRCAMGGTTIADIIWMATKHNINPPYLRSTLMRNRRILPQGRGEKNFVGPR